MKCTCHKTGGSLRAGPPLISGLSGYCFFNMQKAMDIQDAIYVPSFSMKINGNYRKRVLKKNLLHLKPQDVKELVKYPGKTRRTNLHYKFNKHKYNIELCYTSDIFSPKTYRIITISPNYDLLYSEKS